MLVNLIQLSCRARANDNYILPNPLESALGKDSTRIGVNLVTRLDCVPQTIIILIDDVTRLVLDLYCCFSIGSDSWSRAITSRIVPSVRLAACVP